MTDFDDIEIAGAHILGDENTDIARVSIFSAHLEEQQKNIAKVCRVLSRQLSKDIVHLASIEPDGDIHDVWRLIRDRIDEHLPEHTVARLEEMLSETERQTKLIMKAGVTEESCIVAFAHGWEAYRKTRERKLISLSPAVFIARLRNDDDRIIYLWQSVVNRKLQRLFAQERDLGGKTELQFPVIQHDRKRWSSLIADFVSNGWNAALKIANHAS
jgi:hypothetical protein